MMFFEVCIAPDSQMDEFFNKLSFTTCISFLNRLETEFHVQFSFTCLHMI